WRVRASTSSPSPWSGLLALRTIHVGGVAEEHFRRLHDGFRQGRMSAKRPRHVLVIAPHLDGEHAFRDQLSGAGTADPDAEHTPALRMQDELGDAVGAAERDRASSGRPRK